MNWAQKQRLKFIEYRLYWQGCVNREDVQRYFGVSSPMVSNDFSEYLKLNPGAMIYDNSLKRYVASGEVVPCLISPAGEDYLLQVALGDHLFDFTPPVTADIEPVDSGILRELVKAIQNGMAIEVNLDGVWQWITPDTFMFSKNGWELEAFQHLSRKWGKIFLRQIKNTGDSRIHTPPDKD